MGKPFCKAWMEGWSIYRMEYHSNKARKFILCSVLSVESKKLLWIKLYIDENSMPLIDFIDWLVSC